jgi:hypothetical protein
MFGAAAHIILTPANQSLVTGQIIWSLSIPGFELVTVRLLAKRANQLRYNVSGYGECFMGRRLEKGSKSSMQ